MVYLRCVFLSFLLVTFAGQASWAGSSCTKLLSDLSYFVKRRGQLTGELYKWIENEIADCDKLGNGRVKFRPAFDKLIKIGLEVEFKETLAAYRSGLNNHKFKIRELGKTLRLDPTKVDALLSKYETTQNGCRGPEIDLSNQCPPITNQGEMGWCFAFATMDLFACNGKGHFSPNSIAVDQIEDKFKNQLLTYVGIDDIVEDDELGAGGGIAYAAKILQEKGGCPYNAFPQNMDFETDLSRLKHLISRTRMTTRLRSSSNRFNSQLVNELILETEGEFGRGNPEALLREVAPGLSIEEAKNIALNSRDVQSNLAAIINKSVCKNRVEVKDKFDLVELVVQENVDAHVLISDQLKQNKVPGITYHHKVMYSQGFYRNNPSHASTIVGRRWNDQKNQCEYLVRNTWGSDYCPPRASKCRDDGHAWFYSDDILSATGGVTYGK